MRCKPATYPLCAVAQKMPVLLAERPQVGQPVLVVASAAVPPSYAARAVDGGTPRMPAAPDSLCDGGKKRNATSSHEDPPRASRRMGHQVVRTTRSHFSSMLPNPTNDLVDDSFHRRIRVAGRLPWDDIATRFG